MTTAAAYAAQSWPDENRAFMRGYTWEFKDRPPNRPPKPTKRRKVDPLADLIEELRRSK